MENNLRKNVIWNTIGSLSVAITSLFYTLILTRLCSLSQVGLYTIAFALACNTVTIASYGGRTYQVTDTKDEISPISYILSRYITIIFTILILIIYIFSRDYSIYKTLCIIMVCLFKYLEELCDVYYGILQKNDQLYKVGIFQTIKSILNILLFAALAYIFKNILIVFCILLLLNLIFFIFVERKSAKKSKPWKFEIIKSDYKKYFIANFFVCALTFLTTYIINLPKYSIDKLLSDDLQAIFGIIVMPATVMLLVGNFILNPLLVMIAEKYNSNKIKDIVNIIIKIFAIMLIIGILGMIVCYIIGIPFLNIIYGIDLNKYKLSLLIIIFGSIFYAMTAAISSILVAMRKIVPQVLGNIVVILIGICISDYFVKTYGVLGASITYTTLIIVRFIIYVIMLIFIILKSIKRRNK